MYCIYKVKCTMYYVQCTFDRYYPFVFTTQVLSARVLACYCYYHSYIPYWTRISYIVLPMYTVPVIVCDWANSQSPFYRNHLQSLYIYIPYMFLLVQCTFYNISIHHVLYFHIVLVTYTAHYTMYSVYCTLYSVQCIMYIDNIQ